MGPSSRPCKLGRAAPAGLQGPRAEGRRGGPRGRHHARTGLRGRPPGEMRVPAVSTQEAASPDASTTKSRSDPGRPAPRRRPRPHALTARPQSPRGRQRAAGNGPRPAAARPGRNPGPAAGPPHPPGPPHRPALGSRTPPRAPRAANADRPRPRRPHGTPGSGAGTDHRVTFRQVSPAWGARSRSRDEDLGTLNNPLLPLFPPPQPVSVPKWRRPDPQCSGPSLARWGKVARRGRNWRAEEKGEEGGARTRRETGRGGSAANEPTGRGSRRSASTTEPSGPSYSSRPGRGRSALYVGRLGLGPGRGHAWGGASTRPRGAGLRAVTSAAAGVGDYPLLLTFAP